MDSSIPKEYINKITKACSYFIFRNGPIKKLYEDGKVSDNEIKEIQKYMEGHLAYLFNTLLEENNLNKFDLIMSTMDKFYINDNEEIHLQDDGFDAIYNNIFNVNGNNSGIKLNK